MGIWKHLETSDSNGALEEQSKEEKEDVDDICR